MDWLVRAAAVRPRHAGVGHRLAQRGVGRAEVVCPRRLDESHPEKDLVGRVAAVCFRQSGVDRPELLCLASPAGPGRLAESVDPTAVVRAARRYHRQEADCRAAAVAADALAGEQRRVVPGARLPERAHGPTARWSSNAAGGTPRLRGRSQGCS